MSINYRTNDAVELSSNEIDNGTIRDEIDDGIISGEIDGRASSCKIQNGSRRSSKDGASPSSYS